MKVRELIMQLLDHPLDAEVWMQSQDSLVGEVTDVAFEIHPLDTLTPLADCPTKVVVLR